MAEQNRKSDEQKKWRNTSIAVVDAYLDYVFSATDAESIAKESRSILGMYSEHGEIPRSSGFSGFCKLAGKIDRMRYRDVTATMLWARQIMGKLEDHLVEALCVDRCYRGRVKSKAVDPLNGKHVEILYTTHECAMRMDLTESALNNRISDGYIALDSLLQNMKRAA